MRFAFIMMLAFAVSGLPEPSARATVQPEKRTIVLLHGLARSHTSMRKMQAALEAEGFHTCNLRYPSTKHPIETLAEEYILPKIRTCLGGDLAGSDVPPVDFVTHSMGGILVRYMAEHRMLPAVGRVVMLSPPNQGSEVVDKLGRMRVFGWINGPAGRQLGTDSLSVPRQLGAAGFEVGIITGSRSINLVLSTMIEGKDDGKVSIEHAKLDGMADFLVLPTAHPFIMKNKTAIAETLHFLKHGTFSDRPATPAASQNGRPISHW